MGGTWLHAEILRRADATPDNLCIDAGRTVQLSYADVLTHAAALAPALTGKSCVGIVAERNAATYIAILACFFSGTILVPLNPKFPVARLQEIADLAGVEAILAEPQHGGLVETLGRTIIAIDPSAGLTGKFDPSALAEFAIGGDEIAYQLFTSGSTGHPKGVPVSYASLSHYVEAISELLDYPAAARCSQTFDLSFDLAMHDIFVTLANGGTLVPASEMDLLMPHRYIDRRRLDVWFSVPTLAIAAKRGLEGRQLDHRLKLALFCGERLPIELAASFRGAMESAAPLWNLYGPTEATIAITAQLVDETEKTLTVATLGQPFGSNRIAILTEDGAVVETTGEGLKGELLLGGPQVFSGYQPDVADPFVTDRSTRWYRSGDLVAREGGKLHHLGRVDQQIKLRGHRVELAEIEDAARKLFALEAAVALVHGEGDRAQIHLVYVADRAIEDLGRLADVLPDYAVPAAARRMDAFPLNANGKVDRRAIGDMPWHAPA